MHTVYLQIGSNLGNREGFLEKALIQIAKQIGSIGAISKIYESEPWGFYTSNWFLNQVIKVETSKSPLAILHECQSIELELGRRREAKSYTSRTIDIDILLFDDEVLESDELKIPHKYMHERRFVLMPMAEIAPNVLHPIQKKSMIELLEQCTDELEVKLYEGEKNAPTKGRCRI
jgi:2-amino-4-hydroxy-6-hydroxymethyldihydropteridine diphosphokinase